MTEHTGAMDPEHFAAVQRAITETAGGLTMAEAMANLEANTPAMQSLLGGVSIAELEAARKRCHRCDAPATTQWQRYAKDVECEAHWAALEANIRASNDGQPEAAYTADRSQPVVRAVYGCDQHVVDAAHLTHDVDCGGHGACQCEETATDG